MLTILTTEMYRNITHHIDHRDVQEHTAYTSKHPQAGVVNVADGNTNQHTNEAQDGGHTVVDDCLLDGHPCSQQHRKVTCNRSREKVIHTALKKN